MAQKNVLQLLTKVFNNKTYLNDQTRQLVQLNRLYATLSQINQTIVHVKERNILFQEICEASVKCGQFQMAWIGLISENQNVAPVAMAGYGLDYLTNVNIVVPDKYRGKGPTGRAIKEGQCVFCQDIATDPVMVPWRDEALKRGFRASASVPIRQNSKIIGAFSVYAPEPMSFDENQLMLIEEIGIDISFALDVLEKEEERNKAEQDILQSQINFKNIFENSPIGKSMTGLDGLMYVNKSFCEIVGYSAEELKIKSWVDITHPNDIEESDKTIQSMLKREISQARLEKRFIHKNGAIVWVDLLTYLQLDRDGNPQYFVTNVIDITQRKEADRIIKEKNEELNNTIHKVKELEKRWQFALASSQTGAWDLDLIDHTAIRTPAHDKIFGYNSILPEWTYEMFLEHVMKDEREEVDKQFKYAVENKTNWDFQCRIKRCDNEIRWIWACGQHHLDNHNNIYRMAGIIQDITERKKHEEELVKAKDIAVANEVQFRLLLENAPVAIFIQVEQLFGYLNKAALNLYGAQTLEELMGTPVIDRIHPDFKGLVNERIKLILEKDIQVEKKDYKHVALDGSDIDVEVSAVPIKFNHKKGALVFVNDITQRKKTQLLLQEKNNEIESQNEEYKQINEELFRAKEKAEESDRLKTAFLQNMSHEIRTPMNAIMGFSDLMKSNLDNKEKLKYFSHIINQRSNDLLNIVNDMLDIARIESGQLPANMEECNVYAMFEELTSFFSEYQQRIDKMHISFTTRVQGNLQGVSIVTDKVKLKQIFINLLTNAFKFTEEGNIEAGCKLDTGQNLLFYVKDTGIGIPLEKQNIIFERFTQLDQTPKKNVGGIGLGLSIVKGLVDILNGKMFLKSEPGIGSIFSFSIPFKQVQPENKHNHESMTNPLNRLLCKTILLVEDDLYNAEYIQEVLTITGARVLLAETGQLAVHLSLSEPVDLVLMDIRLPDINGYEATRKIHEHKPDLKIIAQTAYASNEEEEKALNAGCNDYISKPTSKNVLLSIVEKYLG